MNFIETLDVADLAQLFNKAPNPYVILDREFRIRAMNDAYLAVTMRSRESILGLNMFEAFPSDPESASHRLLRASLEKVVRTGEEDAIALIPYPIARPDGAYEDRFWSATHKPIKSPSGDLRFILQHTVDVTELHRLRQEAARDWKVETDVLTRADRVAHQNLALAEERHYLRSLFEQAPSFMAVLLGPDHVFDMANAAYLDVVGRGDIVGRSVLDALPEVEEQGFISLLDQVYTSGQPFVAHGARLVLGTGPARREAYLDFIYHPIRDNDGETIGIFVQGHDITEQKLAQDAALESEARFRSLAQSIPNHAWTTDRDGRLEWCNERVTDYSGLSLAEMMGRPIGATLHPDDQQRAQAAWAAARMAGEPFQAEIRLRRRDGAYRWHITRAIPSKDENGAILRWVGTNTDIEDQKTTEAQLEYLAETLEQRVNERTAELERTEVALRQSQKMEAVGNLAGGIAHDFNNLLQVITGSLQLLGRHARLDEKGARYVANALSATDRGAQLAAQLLAFGRRQPLAPKVVNLDRMVRDMDGLIRRSIGEGVEVDTVVAAGLWNTIVDPTNVETALLNLAINARDAMDGHGKLTIEIGNAVLDASYAQGADITPGDYVMLAITDTGAGMPPEILDRVFEPFFSTKPEGKGTGLGLSMVYGFVRQSNGHIRIYSEVGVGTTIRMYLPRSEASEEMSALSLAPLQGGHETILLVEDDDAVRETGVALLRDLGYSVLTARDAASGLAVIESGATIDLLFTDVVMPGPMKSTELARRAQAMLPGLAVLFTSGYTQNSIVHDGKLDSGIDFISKPYGRDQIARKVRQVLDAAHEPQRRALLPADDVAPAAAAAAWPKRALLVDDEALIRMATADMLEDLGLEVVEAGTVVQAEAAFDASVDLLVVDLHLPDGHGLDLARRLRTRKPDIAVVIATGERPKSVIHDLIRAVVIGKPYDQAMLKAAIREVCGEG
ncbi:PAS domain S-box-containing protein [Rhizobium sp. SG_E_25_P2]|uniref:hybrid sensor histidine kinase/response regulator n=1 Tax=Rhizobium sp. SG_E_25_P2 TaxID=2879942 RepID=UPI002473AA2E|nr:PAS domain-containing protein [Rhizobium sp. SG_E_25_P2]MDH6269275.1 PAS domain S-box-containing protein [Rhizobium sp. SG_E_25_P2]